MCRWYFILPIGKNIRNRNGQLECGDSSGGLFQLYPCGLITWIAIHFYSQLTCVCVPSLVCSLIYSWSNIAYCLTCTCLLPISNRWRIFVSRRNQQVSSPWRQYRGNQAECVLPLWLRSFRCICVYNIKYVAALTNLLPFVNSCTTGCTMCTVYFSLTIYFWHHLSVLEWRQLCSTNWRQHHVSRAQHGIVNVRYSGDCPLTLLENLIYIALWGHQHSRECPTA